MYSIDAKFTCSHMEKLNSRRITGETWRNEVVSAAQNGGKRTSRTSKKQKHIRIGIQTDLIGDQWPNSVSVGDGTFEH